MALKHLFRFDRIKVEITPWGWIMDSTVLTILFLLAVIGIIAFIVLHLGNDADSKSEHVVDASAPSPEPTEEVPDEPEMNLVPNFKELPAELVVNMDDLVEIKDPVLIHQLKTLIPIGAREAANIGNLVDAARKIPQGGKFYYTVLEKGQQLARSTTPLNGKEAVRGIVRNEKNIVGQAKFVEADGAFEQLAVGTTINIAIDMVAMAVGCYYMAEINHAMVDIKKGISEITSALKRQYATTYESLVARVFKYSEFESEILLNDQIRKNALIDLDSLESDCTKLLGYAIKTVDELATGKKFDQEKYEERVCQLDVWHKYTIDLIRILGAICTLRYTFVLGQSSVGLCFSMYETYKIKVQAVLDKLWFWNSHYVNKFGYKLVASQRKRTGLGQVIGKVDKRKEYKPVNPQITERITSQMALPNYIDSSAIESAFNSPVKVLAKQDADGTERYYYQSLPELEPLEKTL